MLLLLQLPLWKYVYVSGDVQCLLEPADRGEGFAGGWCWERCRKVKRHLSCRSTHSAQQQYVDDKLQPAVVSFAGGLKKHDPRANMALFREKNAHLRRCEGKLLRSEKDPTPPRHLYNSNQGNVVKLCEHDA